MTSYYFGGAYEVQGDGTIRKYYSFAGQTVRQAHGGALALRTWEADHWSLDYFLTDHLGSIVAVTDSSGTLTSQQRYLPFGQVRPLPDYETIRLTDYQTITDFGYTGQRDLGELGLMDYRARFYSPSLGRFVQPDTVIPAVENPQGWNRYSYAKNSPIIYSDPSGHDSIISEFLAGAASEVISSIGWFSPQLQTDLAPSENEPVAMLAGRVVGDLVSIAIGAGLVGAGGGAITGGTLCAGLSGGGCLPVGAPTAVAGGALILEGTGMSVRGAIGLGTNIVLLAKAGGNPVRNKRLGDAFRDEIADILEQSGYTVRKEVIKKTPFGKRRIDIEVISPEGEVLGGIETKLGNSRYLPSQRAKDAWLKLQGYIVNLLRRR